DHASGAAGEVREAAAGEVDAAGGRHDLLQLVGLVDHHHLVLGEDHTAGGQVEPVEVEVDDDDVGLGGPQPGSFGEAHRPLRAAAGPGALPGRHADRGPCL